MEQRKKINTYKQNSLHEGRKNGIVIGHNCGRK